MRIFAHFGWGCLENAKVKPLRTVGGSNRSRCGAVFTLKMQSEPCARSGWVESCSLWRDKRIENAKRTLRARWAGQIALAAARCAFSKCKVNPLRALGGSNRSRCGTVRVLKMRGEASAHSGWVESPSLWRGPAAARKSSRFEHDSAT